MGRCEITRATKLLIIDDDARFRSALRRALELGGFEVCLAKDASEALDSLGANQPDLVILDIMMPGLSGLHLSSIIRDRRNVPILMLTALDSVPDRIAGLEAGADDYMTKPFATDELVARIQALLRRTRPDTRAHNRLTYSDLALDNRLWEASRAGESLDLTTKEFRLLECFLRSPEQVMSRDDLLLSVWSNDERVESNVVDVHVASLRRKMESDGRPRLLQTIRNVGYILRELP